LAEWLYERGVGEQRAALVEDGAIVEARIEPDDAALRVGAILPARLTDLRARLATLADGTEVFLERLPPAITQGAALRIEITREALPEPGRAKPARATPTDAAPAPAPDFRTRLTGAPIRECRAHEPDALEAAGWSELLDEAITGDIVFSGGALRMSPTPAMTLFDVDGDPPLDTLSVRAATAVAHAIRRHGIGGSIGIDFPTLSGKAPRNAVAAALDAALVGPFERTAMNGFGFLQIVRPRPRASLPELLRADALASAARAALRTLEREPPSAPNRHGLPAAVVTRIESHPDWLTELVRRTGRAPIFDR